MQPTLVVGPVVISTFVLSYVLAFAVGSLLAIRQGSRAGVDWRIVVDIVAWSTVAGILGAKVYEVILHPAELADLTWARFRSVGVVWYGGAIAGFASGAWRSARARLPLVAFFDLGAPVVAVGQVIGRIGCLLAGDDYGFSTSLPWGIALPNGAPPSSAGYLRASGDVIPREIPNSQIMHVQPVMVYEAIGNALIAVFLWRRSHRAYRPWSNFALYCILYGTQRFVLEFMRPKDDRLSMGLTVAQLISLTLVLAGVSILVAQRNKAPRPIREQLAAA